MVITETITLPTVITLVQELIALIVDVKGRTVAFKDGLESLKVTVTLMEPLFKGRVETSCSNQKVLKEIMKKLNEAKVLVEKCDKLPSRSLIRKCHYSRKISNLDALLFRLCQQVLMAENSCAIKLILNNLEELIKTLAATLALTPEKLNKLLTLAATLQGDKQGSESHSTSAPAWTRPPNGFLESNVNGVCHGNPAPAGIGGVCRDANGALINCFHNGLWNSNALEAAVLAIKEGLLVAASRRHLQIYIESYCEMIITILTQFAASSPGGLSSSIVLGCPPEISYIITEIINLQERFKEIKFCQTLQEANYVAASLSSTAAIHPRPEFWDYQPPYSIASTLYSDAYGVYRLI